MADRIAPLPFNPTPTAAQLRDRLGLTLDKLHGAINRWETLDDNERVRIADLLNRHATPLILDLSHINDHPRTVA
jgi:hypothetical protein